MELNNENNIANKMIQEQIEKIVKNAPEGKNSKSYFSKELGRIYGENLANKIMAGLPKDFFTIEENNTNENKETNWLKKLKIFLTVMSLAGIATSVYTTKDEKKDQQEENELKSKNKIEVEITKPKEKEITNPRFNKEIYESLPEQGKEIYKRFSKNTPTPGRSYAFLDKETATQYVFDEKNNLISKIVVGFGKDAGDEPNTSVTLGYNKGKMTTPAGIYLISSAATPSDIVEYGKLQISLYGISILGNPEFLGEHQTYAGHGEYEPRTKKLQSVSVNDNNFSNGCINVDAKDFEKNIAPYFKQDYGEFLFVLPDSLSKENEVKYNTTELIEKIAPMIVEMANKQEAIILKEIGECSIEERIRKEKTLLEIRKKRDAAEKILVKNYK